MKLNLIFLLIFSLLTVSCEKQNNSKSIIVKGVIRDQISNRPVADIKIFISAIKSPSGMGIIAGGRRESITQVVTDNNGRFYANLEVFDEAESLEFKINEFSISMPSPNNYDSKSSAYKISDMNLTSPNSIDFYILPLTNLRIEFKNTLSQNDSDFFQCIIPRRILSIENCGIVKPTEALNWEGANVCGVYNCETYADTMTRIVWRYRENGIFYDKRDSIFTKRNVNNIIKLEY